MRFYSKQKGFTLIEMIVSLAIFTIVALVAIGALLKVMDANKKSQSLKTAINNLNFALESMTREMRVGSNYACGSSGSTIQTGGNVVTNQNCDINNANWVVAFNSSKTGGTCNLIYAYRYSYAEKTIKKYEQSACSTIDLSDGSFSELISKDVKITDSIMRVTSVGVQPKAFFWMKGYTGERAREKTEFELQTTVSQRI